MLFHLKYTRHSKATSLGCSVSQAHGRHPCGITLGIKAYPRKISGLATPEIRCELTEF